ANISVLPMRFEHQRGDLAGGSFVGGHPRRTRRIRGEVDRLCCRSTASVRTGTQPFAPGAGAPTEGERLTGFVVGAPPRCEPDRHPSHPGRVLLPGERGWAAFL